MGCEIGCWVTSWKGVEGGEMKVAWLSVGSLGVNGGCETEEGTKGYSKHRASKSRVYSPLKADKASGEAEDMFMECRLRASSASSAKADRLGDMGDRVANSRW